MLHRRHKVFIVVIGVTAALWAGNTSLFTTPQGPGTRLLAHRGVHQTYSRAGLDNETCTATRIAPPTHRYLENTLPSMQAAFDAGADVVELDVHLTPDGQLAVFHDWTLDCRTDGRGVTEQTPMTTLRSLDVGWGYTADGGETFPLRGSGVGAMPTLDEVLARFPDKRFLVNFKSRRAEEGDAVADVVAAHRGWRGAVWGVYGGAPPTERAIARIDGLRGYSKRSLQACLLRYLAVGWSGVVPAACERTLVAVPKNLAFLLWGWPHRFTERLRAAGSDVVLVGDVDGGGGSAGIDSVDEFDDDVADGFDGYVWTNRIEVLGPALRSRGGASGSRASP